MNFYKFQDAQLSEETQSRLYLLYISEYGFLPENLSFLKERRRKYFDDPSRDLLKFFKNSSGI